MRAFMRENRPQLVVAQHQHRQVTTIAGGRPPAVGSKLNLASSPRRRVRRVGRPTIHGLGMAMSAESQPGQRFAHTDAANADRPDTTATITAIRPAVRAVIPGEEAVQLR